jgi:two-component system sensor histidine kinase MprB
MTLHIEELTELARGDTEPEESEDLRFDLIVSDAVERTERDYPSLGFDVQLEPMIVRGNPKSLGRAVRNILENAAKWNQTGDPVIIRLHDGALTVRDHGPGIDDADLPHVFKRFYRATASRSQPGSGLGLAIVKQVIDTHNGTIEIENAEGGGTLVQMRLPAPSIQSSR